MNFLQLIFIMILGISAAIAFIFLLNLKHRIANVFATLLYMAVASFLLIWIDSPKLDLLIPAVLHSLIGVSAYLFQRYLIAGFQTFKPLDIFFFIPSLFTAALHMPHPGSRISVLLLSDGFLLSWIVSFIFTLACISNVIRYRKANLRALTKESALQMHLIYRLAIFLIFIHLAWGSMIIFRFVATHIDFLLILYSCIISFFILLTLISINSTPSFIVSTLVFNRAATIDHLMEEKLSEIAVPRMFDIERGPYLIDELAELLEVNKAYLSNYLHIHHASNYPGYIRKIRMEKLHSLVEDHQPDTPPAVKELQIACGYRNRGSFNRDVMEYYQMAPRDFVSKLLVSKEEQKVDTMNPAAWTSRLIPNGSGGYQ